MKFLGVTILQDVELPILLLIFAFALQHCSATVIMQSEQLYIITTLFQFFCCFGHSPSLPYFALLLTGYLCIILEQKLHCQYLFKQIKVVRKSTTCCYCYCYCTLQCLSTQHRSMPTCFRYSTAATAKCRAEIKVLPVSENGWPPYWTVSLVSTLWNIWESMLSLVGAKFWHRTC